MGFTKETAAQNAKIDLAKRLNIDAGDVSEKGITDTEFPDMSLGAPAADEMAAQMIAYGWKLELEANGKAYEYRADRYQLRVVDFEGKNFFGEMMRAEEVRAFCTRLGV